jgi:hypothetical protein
MYGLNMSRTHMDEKASSAESAVDIIAQQAVGKQLRWVVAVAMSKEHCRCGSATEESTLIGQEEY